MQNFNVDISAPGGPLVFYAMQADSLSRFFTLTITDSGEAWNPPDVALWSVRFGAPQMPSGWYDTIEDATDATHPAVNVATGVATVATVEIAEQALSTPGQNILCVLVTDSSGYQIASWPIILSIQAVPGLTAPEVTTYYNLLTEQVAQVLQNAQAASASATLAESWAVGGTGTREGEDTNNSEYWAQQSQDAANNRVASFNGRTGAVMPQSGDYTANMVGALSSSPTQLTNEDLNNITNVGFYWAGEGQTTQNRPSEAGSAAFGMAVYRIATGFFRQVYWANYENKTFQRTGNGTSWESWVKIFDAENPPTSIALSPPINIGSAPFDGSAGITLAEMGIPAFPTGYSKSGIVMNSNFTLNSGGYFQFGKITVVNMRVTNKNEVNSNGTVCSGLPKPLREAAGANVALVVSSADHVSGVLYQSGESEAGSLKLYYMETETGSLPAGTTQRLLAVYLAE